MEARDRLQIPRRTAVIGAGPAGCHAAYLLRRAGRQVTVFEAQPMIGGRTAAWRQDGWVIDSGAGFFTNFYPTLWPLLPALGLQSDVVALSRTNALTFGGRLADFTLGSPVSFLRLPFLGWWDKARMAWQTAAISWRYRRLDLSRPETMAVVDDVSARDDAVQRVGERAYQFLVRPGIEPFWYTDCAQVSRAMLLALQAKAATAKFYTLRDGMESVCRGLAHGLDVRTGRAIGAIRRVDSGLCLEGLELSGEELEPFDEVVVATPAAAAARLADGLPDELIATAMRRFIGSQTYVGNTHAAFVIDRLSCRPDAGAVFPCGPQANPVAAINFNKSKHQARDTALTSGQEVISVFLTAAASREAADLPDAAVYERAWQAARGLYPALPTQAKALSLVRRPEAIPVHAVGRFRQAAAVTAAQRPPVVFAGDYLAAATVDGALRSGALAAAALIAAPA